ncbi:MAG: radical SAM protein, partial [Clostridia bacterium]|nr:radical SAM protein [Clostridia bacterium]
MNSSQTETPKTTKSVAKDSVKATKKMKVFKIQRTCVYDGPGIRTTIFFQGCGLRCAWCQNPEGLEFDNAAVQSEYSIAEILDIVTRDKAYYDTTCGGVTLSGGEPLLQNPALLLELVKALKKENIKVTVETTLHAPWTTVEALAPFVDLFFVDLKVVGDDELHKKLTKQDSSLIHSNLKALVELKANIRFRMVMVPSYNDNEKYIASAATLLKLLGYDSIELLKYHNMYEDKAKRLNLDIEILNITPDQSLISLKFGLETFKKYGINAYNTTDNTVKNTTQFTDRVINIQQDIRKAGRALCIEVGKLKTQFYRKNGFKEPTHIHRAKRLKYVLENKTVAVYPQELLVGNFTSKRCAGQVWEEQYGVLDISFLYKLNRQKPVAFQCSAKERWHFYTRIFPFWMKKSLLGRVNSKLKDFIAMLGRSSEMIAGFNNNMAAIAHFIPNYDRILELGTTGLIEEIKRKSAEHPENDQTFYEGAIICLEALADWADRYAAKLKEMAETEQDASRKAELLKLAAICANVPRNPAKTYYEALQAIIFIQIAICNEAYENAVSFGRLDQILYP